MKLAAMNGTEPDSPNKPHKALENRIARAWTLARDSNLRQTTAEPSHNRASMPGMSDFQQIMLEKLSRKTVAGAHSSEVTSTKKLAK